MDASPRMLTLLILGLCLNLELDATSVVGYCGGSVRIKCEYDTKYGSQPKFFCQGDGNSCNETIRTRGRNKWVTKNRYSLLDNGTHYFIVGISELAPSDAGRYHCGVKVQGEEPVQMEVNLEVKDEMSSCGRSQMRTAYVGDSLNITCPYLDIHTQAAKHFCKAYRSQGCDYKASAQKDKTWVHSDKVSLYDNREERTFTAVVNNLERFDQGSYWCGVESNWEHGAGGGYKALIQEVQLTILDTRPTSSITPQPRTLVHTTGPAVKSTETTSSPPQAPSTGAETTSSLPHAPSTGADGPHDKGQRSLRPDSLYFSTSAPRAESSLNLWLMVIYAILALLGLLIVSALVLLVIRRRRAKSTDGAPSLMSMEALWSSPLLSQSLNLLETYPPEPASEEPDPSELKSSDPAPTEPHPSGPEP